MRQGEGISTAAGFPLPTTNSPSKQQNFAATSGIISVPFNLRAKKFWFETKPWVEKRVEKSI